MVKKLLALVLLLLSVTVAAQAQSRHPTGGLVTMLPTGEEDYTGRGSVFTITGDLTTGSDATFSLNSTAPSGSYQIMLGIAVDWTDYYQCVYDLSVKAKDTERPTSITYHFSMPGSYLICLYVNGWVAANQSF